ncbi:Com family DNA-binding transcriptional regulator, partial [Pseudomonas sp. MWU13-2625]
MLKECRCGSCTRLLDRERELTELQIKSSRSGTFQQV